MRARLRPLRRCQGVRGSCKQTLGFATSSSERVNRSAASRRHGSNNRGTFRDRAEAGEGEVMEGGYPRQSLGRGSDVGRAEAGRRGNAYVTGRSLGKVSTTAVLRAM